MRRLIPSICLATLATSTMSAAGREAVPGEGMKRAWLLCARIPDGFENPVKVIAGTETLAVTLSKRSPSGPVPIPADGILRLVGPAGKNRADVVDAETLAVSRIPENAHEALVILLPGSTAPEDHLFKSETIDLANFNGGDWLCINLTHLKIRVEINDARMDVRPRQHGIARAPAAPDKAVPISYSYQDPIHQEWKPLGASTTMLHPTRREICVFDIDPRFDRVTYHGITFPVAQ